MSATNMDLFEKMYRPKEFQTNANTQLRIRIGLLKGDDIIVKTNTNNLFVKENLNIVPERTLYSSKSTKKKIPPIFR